MSRAFPAQHRPRHVSRQVEHVVLFLRVGILMVMPSTPNWVGQAHETLRYRIREMKEEQKAAEKVTSTDHAMTALAAPHWIIQLGITISVETPIFKCAFLWPPLSVGATRSNRGPSAAHQRTIGRLKVAPTHTAASAGCTPRR